MPNIDLFFSEGIKYCKECENKAICGIKKQMDDGEYDERIKTMIEEEFGFKVRGNYFIVDCPKKILQKIKG